MSVERWIERWRRVGQGGFQWIRCTPGKFVSKGELESTKRDRDLPKVCLEVYG
jgi:hypothetical protein